MAINGDNAFNNAFANIFTEAMGQAASKKEEAREEAKYWLNIGVFAKTIVEGEDKPRFIAISGGIPLDDMKVLPTNTRNNIYNHFNAARNNVSDQTLTMAKTLKPGEEMFFDAKPFVIQIRHTMEKVAPTTVTEDNPFAVSLVG